MIFENLETFMFLKTKNDAKCHFRFIPVFLWQLSKSKIAIVPLLYALSAYLQLSKIIFRRFQIFPEKDYIQSFSE